MNRSSAALKRSLLLLLLGGWPVFVPPVQAQPQTLTDWFTFIVADYPSDTSLPSETTYFLAEDSGAQHELLIDIKLMRPLGGLVALNRKWVTVEGEWEAVGPTPREQFRVSAIESAASPSTTLPGRPFAPDLSPDERPTSLQEPAAVSHHPTVTELEAWVTILCRFGDATDVTPHPVSFYEGMMGASYPGLEHYWR